MSKDTSNQFKEYLLSINEFVQPKVLIGEPAAYTDIIRLCLLEPGTNQTHPNMGIGIRTRYRFSDTQDIANLQIDLKNQINEYLPNLLAMDVQVKNYGTTLAIFISSEKDDIYGLGYNTDTGTLGGLTLDDIK